MTMQIATMILDQLGRNRFIAMTGAKHFMGTESGLQFKLPSNFARDGINCVRIDLDASDTYTVRYMKIRGLKITECGTECGIYADMLQRAFTARTGLDTHF